MDLEFDCFLFLAFFDNCIFFNIKVYAVTIAHLNGNPFGPRLPLSRTKEYVKHAPARFLF